MPYTFPPSHIFPVPPMPLLPSSPAFSLTFLHIPLPDNTIVTLQSCLPRQAPTRTRRPLGCKTLLETCTPDMQSLLLKYPFFHSRTVPNPVYVSLKSPLTPLTPLTPRSHSCPAQVHLLKLPHLLSIRL